MKWFSKQWLARWLKDLTISLLIYKSWIEAHEGINYLFLSREIKLMSSSFQVTFFPNSSSLNFIFPTSQNVRITLYYKKNDTFLAVKFFHTCIKIQCFSEENQPNPFFSLMKCQKPPNVLSHFLPCISPFFSSPLFSFSSHVLESRDQRREKAARISH